MSLRQFLEKASDDVLSVKDEASAKFEISQIMKSLDDRGKILLFERVKNHRTRVVANVSGIRKRLCGAIGVAEEDLYERLLDAWCYPKKPRTSTDGEVKEVVTKTVDLYRIPVLTHFEKDAGSYITSGVVHARSIDGKVENVSIHRLQVLDKNHLAMRLVPRHLFQLWNTAKQQHKDLDVSISIGVHPAIMLTASSPLPFGVCEFDVANNLLKGQLKLVETEHVDASCPADAELVLEGRISATKEVVEGPFVDVTGTYDVQRKQPVVEIVGLMHRKDYVYQALLPSGAEHRLLMGVPHETLIWQSVSKVVPKVFAVNLSAGGGGWLHAVVSIEKQLDGDGKNALLAAFAAHPSLKHAVVVDSDIDVFNPSDVEWAIATRFQADEDLIRIKGSRGSTLDSSADQNTGLTTKMGIDATRPFTKPKEKFDRAGINPSLKTRRIIEKLKGL